MPVLTLAADVRHRGRGTYRSASSRTHIVMTNSRASPPTTQSVLADISSPPTRPRPTRSRIRRLALGGLSDSSIAKLNQISNDGPLRRDRQR